MYSWRVKEVEPFVFVTKGWHLVHFLGGRKKALCRWSVCSPRALLSGASNISCSQYSTKLARWGLAYLSNTVTNDVTFDRDGKYRFQGSDHASRLFRLAVTMLVCCFFWASPSSSIVLSSELVSSHLRSISYCDVHRWESCSAWRDG